MEDSTNKQYETVKLPSKGQCYHKDSPLRKGKVKISYLTAKDENIITSTTLLKEGTMCDTLLKEKIVDKMINVGDLCIADRKSLLLWLRKTGNGDEFGYNNKVINLSKVKFKNFKLKGDEQGHFILVTTKGHYMVYRLLTHCDEVEISKNIEEINDRIKSGTDMTEREYYCKVADSLLYHQVISVDGNENINKWVKGLKYEETKAIIEQLKEKEPRIKNKTLNELDFDEGLFRDITK